MKTRHSSLPSHLRSLRLAKGWSMKTAAAKIGVPVSTYRDWEYGNSIRGEHYKRIAEVFGISLEELFGDTAKAEKADILKILEELKDRLDLALQLVRTL